MSRCAVRRLGAVVLAVTLCLVAVVSNRGLGDPPVPEPKREGVKSFGEATKDLKQLGLALHNYEKAYGRLPPAAVRDKNGKLTVSWRVLVLPYIKEDALYKQFKLDEPWDSNHNKKLIAKMPPIFRGPNKKLNDEWKTVYLAPVEKSTPFPPDGSKVSLANLFDGTSNTILLVEANDDSAAVWTKPDDLIVDLKKPMKPMKPINGLIRPGQEFFLAVMCDGSVQRLRNATLPVELANLSRVFSRDDGEVIDYSFIEWIPK